jgi:drug/metabolite transporter (DMT)-like permease
MHDIHDIHDIHGHSVARTTPANLLHPSPYLLLTLSSLFWAGNWVVGRAMRNDIPPVAMGFWRWLLALLILLPFVAPELMRNWRVLRRDALKLALLGALGATVFNSMIYFGLQFTAATNGILFNSISPILTVLMSWALLHDRLSRRQAAGVALSLIGVLAIVARGDPQLLTALEFNHGDLWLIAAMVLWSGYTLLLRWRPSELSAMAFLAAMLVFGLPALFPFYAWEYAARGGFGVTAPVVAALAYYATFPSIVSYLFWNRGVVQVGPNRAALFVHLMPVFGAVLSVIFLGERLYGYHFAGASLIFGGIWLTTRPSGASRAGNDECVAKNR